VKEEWQQDPLAGYRENAKHLFGYPDSTLGEYVRDVTTFHRWLAGRHSGHNPESGNAVDAGPSLLLLAATREEVEDYVVALSSRALRATTINRRIHSLNSFYVWAVHHRLVDVSPLVGVRRLKTPRRIPKFLTFEDISRLLSFTGSLRRTSTIRGKQIHARRP